MRHFENEQARYSTSHKANHREGSDKSGECRLAIKWSDKREVTVLTTIHQAGFVGVERRNRHAPGGRENVEKPIA